MPSSSNGMIPTLQGTHLGGNVESRDVWIPSVAIPSLQVKHEKVDPGRKNEINNILEKSLTFI